MGAAAAQAAAAGTTTADLTAHAPGAAPAASAWPNGDTGRVILHVVVDTSVDALFEDLFGSYSDLQAKLHRVRNDSNCAQSAWVPHRSHLPAQQYMWPAPPAGADPGTPGPGRCRKVRFEAAASIASKAFASEEVQTLLHYAPGAGFLVESEVTTTAMYGDSFTVISRATLSARGASRTQLYLTYAVVFKPALSRLVRPVVAKGVDGGIRGSYATLRRLLAEQYLVQDIPEGAPAPGLPGITATPAPDAAAAAAAATAAAAAAAAAAQPPLLGRVRWRQGTMMAMPSSLVQWELVASLLTLPDPVLLAYALAGLAVLGVLSALLAAGGSLRRVCVAHAPASTGPAAAVCWVVGQLPQGLGQVLSSLALVAAANWLLTRFATFAARHLGALGAHHAARDASSAQLTAEQQARAASGAAVPVAPAVAAAAAAAAPAALPAPASQRQQHSSGGSAPVPIPGASRRAGSPADVPPSGSSGSDGLAALSALQKGLGNVVTGWGRSLLGAGPVDSVAAAESLRAFMSGSWQRPSSAASPASPDAAAVTAGRGTRGDSRAMAAAAADARRQQQRNQPAGQGVARGTQPQQRDEGLRHRHTTSFTAVMDTSGLQIIEDYAAQQKHAAEAAAAAAAAAAGTTGALPSVPESLSPPLLPTAVATLVAAEATSNSSSSPLGSSPAVSGGSPPLLHFAPSPSPVLGDKGRDTAAPLEPPEAAAAAAGDDVAPPDMATASTLPDAAASHQPLPGVGSAPGDSLRHTTPAGLARRSAQGVTWGLSPAPPSSGGSMMPPHTSSFTAVGGALLRTMDAASAPPTLARRSAGPMLFGSAGSAAAGGVAALSPLRPASASPLRDFALAGGNSGAMTPQQPRSRSPLPVPGEELEDEVLVEVFENERAQPFRGWGHTWPGHFLPSDRVGHWSDRDGAPGGPQSMLFDRVAPRLPRGWKWLDEEWTVDLEGLQDEACDAEGWCYGMDFSWMEWPPAPGMGRATIKSFVRRRRWVRARMRVTLADATEVMGDEGRSAADARRPGGGGGVITVSSGRGEDYGGDADADADSGGGAPGGHLPPMRPPPRPPGADASNGGVAALMVPAGVFGAAAAAGLGLAGAADGAAVAAAAASAVVSRIVRAVSSDLPPEDRDHARQGDAMSADSLPPTLLPPAPVPVCDSSAPGLNDGAASSQVHGRGDADDDGGHDDDDDDSSSVDSDAPPQRPFFRPLPQAVGLPDSSSSSSGRALQRALDSSDDDEGADSSSSDKEASPSNACWADGTSDAAAPTDTPEPALAAAQAQNGGGGIAGATTGAAAQTQAALTVAAGSQTADAAGHHDGAVIAAAAHEPAATLSIGAVPVAATPAAAAPGLSDRAQQLGGTPSGASDVAAAQASSSNAAAAQASSSDVAAAQAGSSDVAAAQASSGSASGDDWVWRSAEAAATNAGTAAEHGVLSAAQSQQQVAEALVPAAAADGTAAVAATTTTAATAGTYADTTVQTAAPLPADSPHTAPLVPPVAQQPLASAVAAAADPGGCAAAGKTPRERSSSGASTAPALSTARTGRRGRTRSGSGSGNASGRAGRGRLGAVSLRASGALSPGVLSPRTSSGAEDALSAAARAAADFDAADNVRKGSLALVSGDDAESAATAAQPAEVAAATSLGCAAHPQQRVGDGQEQGQERSKQQQEDEGEQQQR